MNKQYAVIGLGQLGASICTELSNMGCEVLAIDTDRDKVNDFSGIVTQAVETDSTDEKVLQTLGIRNFDHVIVAISRNIQASILTTLLLKEAGVKEIWAKAQNDYHNGFCANWEQTRLSVRRNISSFSFNCAIYVLFSVLIT